MNATHDIPTVSRPAPARRAALLLAAALPFLCGAVESFEERHERIRRMTTIERASLEHNFSTWKSLPQSERDKFRKLDQELSHDAEKNRGQLNALLDRYVEWLGTLNPVQRGELRATTDATAKLALVRKLREEQRQEKSAPPVMLPGLLGGREGGIFRAIRPSPAAFQSMMTIVANRLPVDFRRGLEALEPPQRHVRILAESIRLADGQKTKFPSDDLVQRLAQALEDEKAREKLSELRTPERQRAAVGILLINGLLDEWFQELNRRKPGEPELAAFHAQLPEQEQRRLSELDERQFRFALLKLWIGKQNPELAEDLRRVEFVMKELRPEPFRGENRPGDRAGNRPPFGPLRGPQRGAGNDRPGGERPDDGPDGRPPRRPGN